MTSRLLGRLAPPRNPRMHASSFPDCHLHPAVVARWCDEPFRHGHSNRGPHRWFCPRCHPKGCPVCRGVFCISCRRPYIREPHTEEAVEPAEHRSGDRMAFRRDTGLQASVSKNEKKAQRRAEG